MAIRVVVNVNNAGDWLAANAAARFRLDRDSSAAFDAPTEVSTTVLVSGTERYEIWDENGATASWYRFRIEDDVDSGISGWSTPWQVLASQPIATLASVKQVLGSGASTTDDDMLSRIIDGVNAAMVHRIGYYPGPSDDTTRTYDGAEAVRDGKRLWVPGGVRAVTSLTLATSTGGSGTAATLTDFFLGPSSYLSRPAEPYHYIEFKDVTTGAHSQFEYGFGNVVAVGLFGWHAVPDDLVHIATAWAVRRWKARATGDSEVLGTDEFGGQVVTDRLPAEWKRVIDSYRLEWVI